MRSIVRKLTIVALLGLANTGNVAVADDDAKSVVSKHAANYFSELYTKTCVKYADDYATG